MFAKNLSMPYQLLQTEALERRISKDHDKQSEIKAKIKILKSGFSGEKSLNYQLSQIPNHKYHIFHDIRLPNGNGFFQLDAVLLCSNFLLTIDSKNHSGKIIIEKNQMIQELQETREIFENPVSQANRHKILLNFFLEKYNIPNVPVGNLITFTRQSAEIIISPDYKEAENKICKIYDLLMKIDEIEKSTNKACIDQQTVFKIRNLLLKEHKPYRLDILNQFNIVISEIITGVQCPKCLSSPMKYQRQIWHCPKCNFISKDAHLTAIYDYFLLIKPWFTNAELRAFLHLTSPRATAYLLKLQNIPHSGNTSDRIYHQPLTLPFSANHVFPSPNKQ